MGMVGARELLPGEAPALHSTRRAARAPAPASSSRGSTCSPTAIRARSRRAAARAAAPGSRSRSGCSASRRRPSSRGSSRTSSRTSATATCSCRRSRSIVAAAIVEASRLGGALQRCAPLRARAGRRVVRAPAALAEARVRGRPLRRRALRLAARARRRAAAARAGDGARRVRGEPGDRAALHDEPVRRGGARARSSSRIRRSASACAGCASSTRTGARSSRA